jgi:DNA-binding NtrC family response regulator
VVLAHGDEITLADPPDFLRREKPAIDMLQLELPAQGVSLEAIEKELILRARDKFRGNQTHAAKYLDMSRKALIYRMRNMASERRRPKVKRSLILPIMCARADGTIEGAAGGLDSPLDFC